MGDLVGVRREGPACVITLSRPEKLNALSTALEEELDAALVSDEAREARCVVVAGAGRAFSAGADVNELRQADPASILAYYNATGEVYERFASLPQPTIAAVHGYCLGGGFELALAADLRVADETAVFGLPEVGIGIVPSSGGTLRLVRAVGPARAKELMLVRPRVTARDALELGLVTEVVEDGNALERALKLAEAISELPPLAVQLAKRSADAMADASRDAALLIERLAYGTLAQTHDAREAAEAFTEKREPRFEGR
jgi:enoyl-CoA hydratase/carnithine racemase